MTVLLYSLDSATDDDHRAYAVTIDRTAGLVMERLVDWAREREYSPEDPVTGFTLEELIEIEREEWGETVELDASDAIDLVIALREAARTLRRMEVVGTYGEKSAA